MNIVKVIVSLSLCLMKALTSLTKKNKWIYMFDSVTLDKSVLVLGVYGTETTETVTQHLQSSITELPKTGSADSNVKC